MPVLEVSLLGPPAVKWQGRSLSVPRRQARALLYCLAARLQPLSRETLCALFWPTRPEATARRNLSHLLTHLRRALPDADILLAVDDQVALDAQRSWSDTAVFVQHPSRQAAPPIEALQQAVDRYRGPFLEGFSLPQNSEFDAWLSLERQHWEQQYLRALAALITAKSERGAYKEAIAYGRRYLAVDDLAEEIHRRLMEMYAATGDQCAALRQYEQCLMVLERELGVDPLPETRALYQDILKGRSPLPPPAEPAWTTFPGAKTPLVGRDKVLHDLQEAFSRALAADGRIILVAGEAGIGKSHLLQAFTAQQKEPALVLVGAAHLSAQTLPYGPVVEALRSLPSVLRSLDNLPAVWLAEASRLLPELRTLYSELPPPLPAEPEEARTRLFEALSRIFRELAAGASPLILCLEDLHWADGATLEWLAYLAQSLRGSRLLVLASYRVEEGDVLATLRRGLRRAGLLAEIKLVGLETTAVYQLLHHFTDPFPGDKALATRLQKATGGNPFFLLEMLRVLATNGRSFSELVSLKEIPLPDSILEAITFRLQRLRPIARQILEAAAILSPSFSFDLVRLTAGRREIETLDGLEQLLAAQLLAEQEDHYGFQHDLTRRAVEESLTPVRHQLLHRRAGRALEELNRHAIARLASHFEAGGLAKKALYYHGLAAQRAESLFAWREAIEHQNHMLALLEQLDSGCLSAACRAQRGQILAEQAHLHFLQGRLEDRDACLANLAALARTAGDEELHLLTLVHQTRYLNLDSRYEQAITTAVNGVELAQRLDDTFTHARLLAQIGFAHYFLGQPHQALSALEAALATGGEGTGPETRGRIAHILGYVHFHLGNHVQALACQQEAYDCHQRLDDHNRMAWDQLDVGVVYREMGRFTEARTHLRQGLALARRISARPAEAYGLTQLGLWQLYQGHYGAALDDFQQSLSLQTTLCNEHGIVAAEVGLGFVFYHLGDLAQARCWLQQAVRWARAVGHRRRLSEALIGLGMVVLADGRFATAHDLLQEAIAIAVASDCPENLAAAQAALARTERLQGRLDDALAHAREAISTAQESKMPVCRMWAEMEVGLVLLAQDDYTNALLHTQNAVDLLPQANESWIGTEQIRDAHALVLQSLGEDEAANEQLRLACAIVSAKAAHIPDARQRQRYRQSQLPVAIL